MPPPVVLMQLGAEHTGAQISKNSTNDLKVIGARKLTKQVQNWRPQILGTTMKNLVATSTWCLEHVRPFLTHYNNCN
jgi:hypothetical protein